MKQDKFFAQSYMDAWNDYNYSCNIRKAVTWDWIIITAANRHQGEAYQLQINKRLTEKRLPLGTRFAVVSDFNNERIGSGGATLNVLRYVLEKVGYDNIFKQKILLINSGGDSKRIPQYSACGKLFAPVPRMLPTGKKSTLFDELLIVASGIPYRTSAGLLVFPSDTEFLFNPLQLDLLSCDAAGLTIKAPVSIGKDHGVFLQSKEMSDHRNRNVSMFLHKQPESTLREVGAVDSADNVDIDTGCIWLGEKVVRALLSLISEDGKVSEKKFRQFVNEKVCLNFYADFVYPLAENSTLAEFYKEAPENGYNIELTNCRTILWNVLHEYRLSLVKMIPARYIHFGMTHEMFDMMVWDLGKYEYLGWQKRLLTNATKGCAINSYIDPQANISENTFIEDSIIHKNCSIKEGTIISNIVLDNCSVPQGVVLHGLRLKNGKFVCRIFGKDDNPKASQDSRFLGKSLATLLRIAKLNYDEIWTDSTASIWNAKIYSACDSMKDAVSAALRLYGIINNDYRVQDLVDWRNSERYSLKESFYEADIAATMDWQDYVEKYVKLKMFIESVSKGIPLLTAIKNIDVIETDLSTDFINNLEEVANSSFFPLNMRLFLALSELCKKYNLVFHEHNSVYYEDMAYDVIRKGITKETFKRYNIDWSAMHFIRNEITVELPVRVNFCGSPSDAAPYCLEHGGTMLDGALLLKGKAPIKVNIQRLDEYVIVLESIDQGSRKVFRCMAELADYGNPYDLFALHKAVLVACGLIPYTDHQMSLTDLCSIIGGGFLFSTSVDVPKGSGLGTSSILAAAALKALNMIFNQCITDEKLYSQVFLAEQLMSTGGGWQDQVGGLTPGIKYFTSKPGMHQKIDVDYLNLADSTFEELNRRFALIFSGQRRLARNVLREEMNQCIRNDLQSMEAISQIQEYCAIMRYYLLKGDVTLFAKYITKQFNLVKMLDKGASNTCIEYIFDVCDDLIDGKSICGAGGGGFLQVILKDGVTKKQLKERICHEFIDCGVEVWDCEFVK